MTFWQSILYRYASRLAREIADDLIGNPAGWRTADGYFLCSATLRIDIWIANADYALRVRVWPIKPGFPCEIRPPWVDRSLLWSLIRERREPSPRAIERARALDVLRQRRAA